MAEWELTEKEVAELMEKRGGPVPPSVASALARAAQAKLMQWLEKSGIVIANATEQIGDKFILCDFSVDSRRWAQLKSELGVES